MRDGNGFFAGLSCALSSLCVYWAIAAVLILGSRGWDIGLFWFLAAAALSAGFFELFLKKERPVPLLAVLTGLLGAVFLAFFILWTQAKLSFLHILVMAVGAGMAVGMPLYGCLKRPSIHQMLSYLDVTILTFVVLLLCGEYLGIGPETNGLFVLVLLMDAAAAVGLRMRDGGDGRSARKATLVALACAGLLALAVLALVSLFSRSGGLTGSILGALSAAFQALGSALNRIFAWLAALLYRPKTQEALELPEGMSALTAIEGKAQRELVIPPVVAAVLLALVVLAVIFAVVLFFRKVKTAGGKTAAVTAAAPARVSRVSGALREKWQAFLKKLRFVWEAFRRRNSPAGLLVWLERQGKKARKGRRPEETMRQFIARMAPDGRLSPLADALDMEYYGGKEAVLSPAQCRKLRQLYRKAKGE